ncbi:hypothetical protein JKP88DRAFT_273111 [Tribonema minus]|uniref:Uncharacterized protein n=1 Tax=Tribonema minus TaxID=303371 RepID=A0A835YYM2_9STRA|nr:hypothetical protein JKP88DRAFT_273111 [Tribonema minus]
MRFVLLRVLAGCRGEFEEPQAEACGVYEDEDTSREYGRLLQRVRGDVCSYYCTLPLPHEVGAAPEDLRLFVGESMADTSASVRAHSAAAAADRTLDMAEVHERMAATTFAIVSRATAAYAREIRRCEEDPDSRRARLTAYVDRRWRGDCERRAQLMAAGELLAFGPRTCQTTAEA